MNPYPGEKLGKLVVPGRYYLVRMSNDHHLLETKKYFDSIPSLN